MRIRPTARQPVIQLKGATTVMLIHRDLVDAAGQLALDLFERARSTR